MEQLEFLIQCFIVLLRTFSIEGWIKLRRKDIYFIDEEKIRLECADLSKNIAEVNHNVVPTEITHMYRVVGGDLYCDYKYKGKINKNNTSEMLFTFSSTNACSYENTNCYTVEMKDGKEFTQNPRLVSTEGLVKKAAARFKNVLNKGDSFDVSIHIELKNCIGENRDYIISQLKYAKDTIADYNVEIEFDREIKNNVRVYELKNGKMHYVTTLECDSSSSKKFCDSGIKTKGISLRAYIFDFKEGLL